MKVKDLIEKLQQLPQDLDVYAYTDHGQTPEGVCSPSVVYFDDDFEYFTADEDKAREEEYFHKGVIL